MLFRSYTVETCRHVCADAFIAPNNGSAKVYVFTDADNIQLPAQNSLLKIVEEPPDFVYFIFTASSKDVFLPTIISRVTSVGVSPCTFDECAQALGIKGYESSRISEAMENFGGNIGMCVEYLENESLRVITSLTKRAADSIISRDEYSLLTVMSSANLPDRCHYFCRTGSCCLRRRSCERKYEKESKREKISSIQWMSRTENAPV